MVLLLLPKGIYSDTSDRIAVLGIRKDCPPFSYIDETESYQGYSVDLCNKIAKSLKENGIISDYRYREISAKNRFQQLAAKEIDILCEATTVTVQRLHRFRPTLYTFISGASFMYPMSATAMGKTDKIAIGSLKGTTTIDFIRKLKRENESTFLGRVNLENAELRDIDSHFDAIQEFRQGNIQYYFADREILINLREIQPAPRLNIVIAPVYLTVEPYALFTRYDDLELSYIANLTLRDLYTSGEIEQIFQAHFKGKKMSTTLVQIFRMQRLLIGTDPLPQ